MLDREVCKFLDNQNHPLRNEIEVLRNLILHTDDKLLENIKWNGPNYSINGEDRVTMKINPPKNIQLIFHRGAKKLTQPLEPLVKDDLGILSYRENDRAIATFKNMDDILKTKTGLVEIVKKWILATT